MNAAHLDFESLVVSEGDIPITEITLARAKPIPTEPRALSNNPKREEVLSAPMLVEPDIHDANREKIIIRPRCKAYVEKQKQKPLSIRTLACFTPPKTKEESVSSDPQPDVEMDDATLSPSTPRKVSAVKATELFKPKIRKCTTRTPPTAPRALMSVKVDAVPVRSKPTVLSGRIEKPPKTPPRKVELPNLAVDSPSIVDMAAYELYTCGCSAPSDCHICTLRRLFDKFCSIVTARKELIRVRQEANAMYS
ncbi:hypothetical protein B0H12DRAFT_116313 [Mycena haematopus]|nr:hypothetical protein B0H12DRAFT_116313 [Mycena haematopus]